MFSPLAPLYCDYETGLYCDYETGYSVSCQARPRKQRVRVLGGWQGFGLKEVWGFDVKELMVFANSFMGDNAELAMLTKVCVSARAAVVVALTHVSLFSL